MKFFDGIDALKERIARANVKGSWTDKGSNTARPYAAAVGPRAAHSGPIAIQKPNYN